MYCNKCGNQLKNDKVKFCSKCGEKIENINDTVVITNDYNEYYSNKRINDRKDNNFFIKLLLGILIMFLVGIFTIIFMCKLVFDFKIKKIQARNFQHRPFYIEEEYEFDLFDGI